MMELRAHVLPRLLVLVLLAAVPGATLAASRSPAPRSGSGETVEVEIKIVPFYAVDAAGKPVWDLRSDEVELHLGGKKVFMDTFDGPAAPGGLERNGSNGLRPASRNVIFLLDSAFTPPAGFRNALQVAEKLAGEVPEGDRLSLLTHTTARGLEKKLGLVRADGRGKARFRAELGKLVPEGKRLSTEAPVDMMADTGGNDRNGKPMSQVVNHVDMMRGFSRGEYEGVVRQLADSLELTAAELRHLRGPKLFVVLWQGIDPELYFRGDFGVKLGSGHSVLMDVRRFDALQTRFTGPLQALADSGTMTVFVNPTAPPSYTEGAFADGFDPEGPIRNIASTAGGLYASGADPRVVEQRVATATAAYYEAGFYVQGEPKAAREAVEVVVKRPGVRAWAPSAVKVRDTWEALSAYEKRLLILEVVAGGPESQRGPVRLHLQELGGKIQSRPGGGGRHLLYDAVWPESLNAKDLDLYNVALSPPASGEKLPRILRFDWKAKARLGAEPLETVVDKSGKVIWGIVAVEPATGRAWYRRLQVAEEK
jgi:hypothetical protein